MDSPSTSTGIQKEQVSAYGFPEQDVIKYINSRGLSKEEARDFMLFLTFANQIKDTIDDDAYVIFYASALVNIVTRADNATTSENSSDAVESDISNSACSVDEPSISSTNAFHSLTPSLLMGSTSTPGKHNDIKFYPNIICVICKEWICSRSRRLHIGAHMNYRKYKCSTCGFLHTKEIFISSHIRTSHDGHGIVVEQSDPLIENRIENICRDSIAMTRDVLNGSYNEKTYADYSSMTTPRNHIANKERYNRTKMLTVVADATNSQ